jgi:hypothetical protein
VAENSGKQRGRPFQPGVSGNPGGRPKVDAEVRAAAQLKGIEAINKLAELMTCGKLEVELRAAEAILDRAIGRPRQAVDLEGKALPTVILAGFRRPKAGHKETS